MHQNLPIERRFLARSTALAFTAVALTGALLGGCSDNGAVEAKATTTKASTTTTTTTSTTTTTTPPPVAIAPLSGVPVDAAAAETLRRPALAVKIDNSVDAMPQEGLNQADIVFEIKVEGISRLMAVFHSTDAGEIGPTRSARYSDPPILALLGKPLFGWSGANDGVVNDVYKSSWIVNVNWDKVKNSDYFRKSGRRAPHNLFTSTQALFAYRQPDQPPPLQMFQYLGPGESNTGTSQLAGMTETIGDTPSAWVWDATGNHWLRWQYGRRDMTVGSGQANAQNVVILEVEYKGGSKTPTAKLDGTGKAIVMSAGGTAVVGTWTRPNQLEPVTLTGADGQVIRLAPGRTWVELTPGPTAQPMSPEAAAALLAG